MTDNSRPNCARCLAAPAIIPAAVTPSIQERSSAATKCSVPRIGQDLTTEPLSSASYTSLRLRDVVRSATDVTAPAKSCACIAVIHRTASVADPNPGPAIRWAISRSRPRSRGLAMRSFQHGGAYVDRCRQVCADRRSAAGTQICGVVRVVVVL